LEKFPEIFQKNILPEIRGNPPKSCFLAFLGIRDSGNRAFEILLLKTF